MSNSRSGAVVAAARGFARKEVTAPGGTMLKF